VNGSTPVSMAQSFTQLCSEGVADLLTLNAIQGYQDCTTLLDEATL